MGVREHFTEAELTAIRDATKRAESRTAGEVVCVIVARCDAYVAATWKGIVAGALLGVLAAVLAHEARGSWGAWGAWGAWGGSPYAWLLLPALAGGVAGGLAARFVSPLRRLLVGEDTLDLRAERRAAVAFVDEEVFATRQRTGVLILVALFEHRVEIVADRGLRERVADDDWKTIACALAGEIKRGRAGPALVEAIDACADLLVKAGIGPRTDDDNELCDEPRLHDA